MLKLLCILVVMDIAIGQMDIGKPTTRLELTLSEKYYRRDYRYSGALNGWYKFHEIPMEWLDARKQCTLEKAFIMSPINDTFVSVFREIITQKLNRRPYAFTGFSTMLTSSHFISYEGILLDTVQHEWADREPKPLRQAGKGNCLTIDNSGKLAVENCTEFFPFVCYKKFEELKKNDCGYISGYDYDKSTDRCYKVYATPKQRFEAYRVCAADDGELVVVDSDQVANNLKKYFKNRDVYGLSGDLLQVGVHSAFEENEWLTVHGESLNETQYESLKIFDDNHKCVSLWKNGEMWSVECDSAQPFVCQKAKDLGYPFDRRQI